MGLRFDPVGGGQFKQALKQIIEIERQPIKGLETRKSREDARLKLFNDFKGKFTAFDRLLNDFTSFRKFRELKVDLGDGDSAVSVTLDKELAEPGTYQLQINNLAERSAVLSNRFKDPDEKILGVGFVVAEGLDGTRKEIFIDEKNSSLNGLVSMINTQKELPFRATVVKDASNPEAPFRVILAAKADGEANDLKFPDFYFMSGSEDFYITEDKEALNASVSIDGFDLEFGSNMVKDFVRGVNLRLKQPRPDQPFTMSITEDYQKISGKVKGLVDQVNSILDFVNKQNTVDEKSDTSATFTGDSGLQGIEYRFRNLVHEGFPVASEDGESFRWVFLNEIGIEFDKKGVIQFKEEKFTKALQADFEGIAEAITGEHGFASQLRAVVAGYTRGGDGFLTMRENALRGRIKQIDTQIAEKERRLEQRQQMLTEQFSRLEASLGALQRQSQYLSATMGGGGGNMVSQLLGG